MKGWLKTNVKNVIKTVKPHGYLKVLDEQDLVVEVDTEEDYEKLTEALTEKFGNEVFLEKL